MTSSNPLRSSPWLVKVSEELHVEFLFPSKQMTFALIKVPSVSGEERYTRNPDGTWQRIDGNFSTKSLPASVRSMKLDMELLYSRFLAQLILDE